MSLDVEPLGSFAGPGPLVVTPRVHHDERGFFLERYKEEAYTPHGIGPFVQDNHSRSTHNVVRGLHWQLPPHAQGKLVSAVTGRILDVAVDLRHGSPTFGRWASAVLDDETHRQLWVPAGFAHGFLVLSDVADVHYKVTAGHARDAERSLRWNDPQVNVAWGVDAPTLSAKDAEAPLLRDLTQDDLFAWEDEA